VIHQELSLATNMSVADNLFLGSERTSAGFIRQSEHTALARKLLKALSLDLNLNTPVDRLPLATQQLLEIAKALRHNAKVIVMDEPTSALNAQEVESLFSLIAQLKADGCGIVYITHKMEEIEKLADRITVLRDGQLVGVAPASELPAGKLVQWMVGREITAGATGIDASARKPATEERFEVSNFSVVRDGRKLVDNVSLKVRRGEVVGIGGLQGSGASELLNGLFGGYGRNAHGRVLVDGKPVRIKSPQHSIANRIGLLTNDRKVTGLVLPMSVVFNTTLADLKRLTPFGLRRPKSEVKAAAVHAKAFRLKSRSPYEPVGFLSGGNQQKVALAKWIQIEPKVLLLDEPTRGIDIGAKRDIYALIQQWTEAGMSILLITSELPELLELSDRIVVMHRGRITAEMDRSEATADWVIHAAMASESEAKHPTKAN